MQSLIAITIGDINGIGPEIILRSLKEEQNEDSSAIIIGPPGVIQHYNKYLGTDLNITEADNPEKPVHGTVSVYWPHDDSPVLSPGIQSAESGKTAMLAIETAIKLCLSRRTHAMVTAPISKEAVNLAGYDIPGHTEFLADKTGTKEVLMTLINDGLRVAVATTHIPVSKIADTIDQELIVRKAEIMDRSLRSDFGIEAPRIAVFGLNPHAGDGGVIGSEELDIIAPAIRKLEGMGIGAQGPFPADGFFGQKLHQQFDGILAMYHDQGLVPFKMLAFEDGVNYTAGLPIVRTSPDHGTAFDIAGQGTASPGSMRHAIYLAVDVVRRRRAHQQRKAG